MSEPQERIDFPTINGLKTYLHYQHPSTSGDILLNNLCDQLKQYRSVYEKSKHLMEITRGKKEGEGHYAPNLSETMIAIHQLQQAIKELEDYDNGTKRERPKPTADTDRLQKD